MCFSSNCLRLNISTCVPLFFKVYAFKNMPVYQTIYFLLEVKPNLGCTTYNITGTTDQTNSNIVGALIQVRK